MTPLPSYTVTERFVALRIKAKATIPGFDILEKRNWFWKLVYYVSFMWIWNKRFLDNFVTTVGAKMYVPNMAKFGTGPNVAADYALLRHEVQHMKDSIRFGPLWAPLYLFPQCLALLAFGAFWNLYFLLALLFLAPWPAPFRTWAEQRGYDETYRAYSDLGLSVPWTTTLEAVLKSHFCGWDYWRMSWRWAPIQAHYKQLFQELFR